MAGNRHTAEQIVGKLREVEVHLSKRLPIARACKQSGITDQTYYRWRKEYGGLRVNQAKRLKELERENGYCKSFNGKLRTELLNGEIFSTLREAKVLLERWRVHYNTVRPHSSLGYSPPAPKTETCSAPLHMPQQPLENTAGLT